MDTMINLRRGARNGQENAYGIQIFPILDYRLIRVELGEELLARTPSGRTGLCLADLRPGARRRKKRQERLWNDFSGELAKALDERDDIYCLTDRELRSDDGWRADIPFPEFDGYLEKRWARRLLPYAVYPRFTVLGTAPYLPELLCSIADRMKSILWILPDYCHAEMLEDFAEEFYQEYGLAIDLQFLGINESYGQLRVAEKWLREPMNILDFTQDRHIPVFTPGAGSIWLDMASVEEKRRRIGARRMKVFYFSLKKQWEQPQNTPYLLDTVNKNRYNT